MKSLLLVAAALAATTGTTANSGEYTVLESADAIVQKAVYQPVATQLNSCGQITHVSTLTRRPNSPSRPSRVSSADLQVGSTVTAPSNYLGTETGFVLLKMGPAVHECSVLDWTPRGVTFEVPDMGLSSDTTAELQLVRPDGSIVRNYRVNLVRKPDLIVHDKEAPGPSAGAITTANTAETNGLVMSEPAPTTPIVQVSK
ncbi:MAG: hypothetical protein KDA37_06800 [Planctomycetales bacterium]|nr:hypothetical protein [Planctomycetales bacterium]